MTRINLNFDENAENLIAQADAAVASADAAHTDEARAAAYDAAEIAVDAILEPASQADRDVIDEYVTSCYAEHAPNSINYLGALKTLRNAYIMTSREAYDAESVYEELLEAAGYPAEYMAPGGARFAPHRLYELDALTADGQRQHIVDASRLDIERRALLPVNE